MSDSAEDVTTGQARELATLARDLRLQAELNAALGFTVVRAPAPPAPPARSFGSPSGRSGGRPVDRSSRGGSGFGPGSGRRGFGPDAAPAAGGGRPDRGRSNRSHSGPDRPGRGGFGPPGGAGGDRGAPAPAAPRKEPAAAPEPARARAAPAEESDGELTARRAEGEQALSALAAEMKGCELCRLCESRTRLVFGQGDAAAELMFVGEGPGYNEDQQGLAFVGKAGQLLTKMIEAMGLSRDEVFIANIVKCRPPDNRNPEPDEMAQCLPFLERQLAIVRPRVIVALGKTAGVGLGLLRPRQSLSRNRGFHRRGGVPVMLTYHPAYLLRQPREKKKAWHDLQQVMPYVRRRGPGAARG